MYLDFSSSTNIENFVSDTPKVYVIKPEIDISLRKGFENIYNPGLLSPHRLNKSM